jgi:cytochrome c-type biogenesis protein CcmH/NrfG
VDCCTKALTIDPTNIKALFRRGQAHVMKNDFERARADYAKVSRVLVTAIVSLCLRVADMLEKGSGAGSQVG